MSYSIFERILPLASEATLRSVIALNVVKGEQQRQDPSHESRKYVGPGGGSRIARML
jgi:hypothetical protein